MKSTRDIITAVLLIISISSLSGRAQTLLFNERELGLPDLGYSAIAWGDYDHDGDLDIAMSGVSGNTPVSYIFRNQNGVFTNTQSPIPGLHQGSVEWADLELDGDLDLLVTGMDAVGAFFTKIIRNDTGTFVVSDIDLPGVWDGMATWGDSNNDGYPDILISGNMMTTVFENQGDGTFTDLHPSFPDLQSPMVAWCDYNNDGWVDVMLSGDTGGGFLTALFRNDHGTFSKVTITPEPFLELYSGQLKWADLDLDGDQDLVITGIDLYIDAYLVAYRNDGQDQFTKILFQEGNFLGGSLDLGDFNSDGLPDLIVMGRTPGCGGEASTLLFKNEGNLNFEPLSTLLPGFKVGGVSWGDLNNDGFSDLIFSGFDSFDNARTSFYLNNFGDTLFRSNTSPVCPDSAMALMMDDHAFLTWSRGSDMETPEISLTYNLMIGTQPNLIDVMSPMSIPLTGLRTLSGNGNGSTDTSWVVSGLAPGTYYYSVQTIDNGYLGSSFSVPCMFQYQPVGIDLKKDDPFMVYPNPSHGELFLGKKSQVSGEGSVELVNIYGEILLRTPIPCHLNLYHLPSGIYFAVMTLNGTRKTEKVLLQNP
jgi:hypothetical protein